MRYIKLFIFFNLCIVQFSFASKCNDKLFISGLKSFSEEQYSVAREYFRMYLESCKNNLKTVEAEYYYAFCSLLLKHPNGKSLFNKFIKDHKDQSKISRAYYQLGNICFIDQEYENSIEYYERIDQKKLDTNTKYKLQYRLAYAYLNGKNFEQALLHFNEIKLDDHPYTFAANYYSGYIELRNKNYKKALENLNKAGESESYRSVVPYLIAQTYYQQKRYKVLIEYIKESYNKDLELKNQDEIELMLADSHRALNNFEEASIHYENYLVFKDMKVESEILYRASYSLYKSGKTNKAISRFQTLAVNEDDIGQLSNYYLGKIYLYKGLKSCALTSFKKSYESKFCDNVREESGFLYATLNYELGKPLIAIEVYKEIKKDYPNSAYLGKINTFLSELYLSTDNYDLAIEQVEREHNKSKRMLIAYQKGTFYRGSEHFSNFEYDDAITMFNKSIKSGEDIKLHFAAKVWLAECFSAKLDYQKAIKIYHEAIDPKLIKYKACYQQALYGLAYAYFNSQNYKRALYYFTSYIKGESFSKNKTFFENSSLRIGDCLYVLNKYDESIKSYSECLKNNSRIAYAYLQKGIIYYILDKLDLSENNFKIILDDTEYKKDSCYEDALYYYAQVAFRRGLYKESIIRYERFISEKPKSKFLPQVLLNKAIANININQNEKAVSICKILLSDYPETDQAYSSLLELQKIVDSSIFEKYLKEYKQINPENDSLPKLEFESAKTYFYDQKYNKAIEAFRTYLKKYKNNVQSKEAIFLLAQSYNRLGHTKDALDQYYKILNYDKSSFQNRAVYNKAILQMSRLEYETDNYNKSFEHYKILNSVARNKKETLYSLEGLMMNAFALNKYEDTIDYSLKVIRISNMITMSYRAKLFFAKASLKVKKNEVAIKSLQDIIRDSKSSYAAEAQYLISKDLYDRKKYSDSLTEIFKLNNNYPNYKNWVDKGFFLIVQNYLALNDTFQAKATLQSIVENSSDKTIIEKAREKISKIEKMADEKLKLISKDTIKSEDKKDFYTID